MTDKNNLNEFRKQYEKIQASDDLKRKVDNIIKKDRRNFIIKNVSISTASIFALSIIILNAFPSIALAANNIPIINSVVRVLTFNRYEYKDTGYEASIVTPRIEGLLDKNFENELNEYFKEYAKTLIIGFEEDVKRLKETFGNETVHMGIVANYKVKTDTKSILAVDFYEASSVGTLSKHNYYTIDKQSKRLLTLEDLFNEGSNYITPINQYLTNEMKRLNRDENGMFWIKDEELVGDSFKGIGSHQKFYINSNNELVICFDKHEVAARAQGTPEFIIPLDRIKDLLSTQGKRCLIKKNS
ncbi:RsiV family protein [Bacteroides faecichinchillae]|uniref:RsiV family protein n=1 Tax=Bacteroides faecichinchillae TaxID=871325 RepID=UPI003518BB22